MNIICDDLSLSLKLKTRVNKNLVYGTHTYVEHYCLYFNYIVSGVVPVLSA